MSVGETFFLNVEGLLKVGCGFGILAACGQQCCAAAEQVGDFGVVIVEERLLHVDGLGEAFRASLQRRWTVVEQGEVSQSDGDGGMRLPLAEKVLTNRQGLLQGLAGGPWAFARDLQTPQIAQRLRHPGALPAENVLVNRHRLFAGRFGLGIRFLRQEETGLLTERVGDGRMLGAEDQLAEAEEFLIGGFRFVVSAKLIVHRGQQALQRETADVRVAIFFREHGTRFLGDDLGFGIMALGFLQAGAGEHSVGRQGMIGGELGVVNCLHIGQQLVGFREVRQSDLHRRLIAEAAGDQQALLAERLPPTVSHSSKRLIVAKYFDSIK